MNFEIISALGLPIVILFMIVLLIFWQKKTDYENVFFTDSNKEKTSMKMEKNIGHSTYFTTRAKRLSKD